MVRPAALRELKLAIAAVLAAAIAAGAASRANAQAGPSRADLRQACGADARAVCSGITPGGGRIKQCMIENSINCRTAAKPR